MLNVITGSTREASRIHARLLVATGTYVLQTNRATYNRNDCDATCLLCGDDDETLSHFLLECSALEETWHQNLREVLNARDQVLGNIGPIGTDLGLVQLIVDCTGLVHYDDTKNVKPDGCSTMPGDQCMLYMGYVTRCP